MRGGGTILPQLIGFLIIDGPLHALLARRSQRGFSYSASFCPVNSREWKINILWKQGLTCPHYTYYFYQRDLCRVRSGLLQWGRMGESHWKTKLCSLPLFGPLALLSRSVTKDLEKHKTVALLLSFLFQQSPKSELELTETRLKMPNTAEETYAQVSQHHRQGTRKPSAHILSTAFCLQTFTSRLFAQINK